MYMFSSGTLTRQTMGKPCGLKRINQTLVVPLLTVFVEIL